MKSDLHDVSVIFQHQTERAVCVRDVEDGSDIWIPLSQCQIDAPDGNLRRGGVATLTASENLLTEKGLI
ncbi:hypothetical protein [Roseinatronobacter sp. NSM]|uniref:hypothetical protein n=1 Tax=Roseinatronobacter sp. NSM TaxID=3457785 RepID=UPI0040361810